MIFIVMGVMSLVALCFCAQDAVENGWTGMDTFCVVFTTVMTIANFALAAQTLI